MNKLMECIGELQKNHTGAEIAQALREYMQLVEDVARDYSDGTTVLELKNGHPELDFMDDDEIAELLVTVEEMRKRMLEELPDPVILPMFRKRKNYYCLFRFKKDGTYHLAGRFESDMKPSRLLKEFRMYIKWREKEEVKKAFDKFSIGL